MTTRDTTTLQVVLTDANVLYPRVLRDYLLYAAEHRIIAVAWSAKILQETVEHLIENRPGFTRESADALVAALTKTFPYAQRDPAPEHYALIEHLTLPDKDDRHVIAAVLAAEADVLCTENIADFPRIITSTLGFEVVTPDQLICHLVVAHPETMRLVHETSIANLPGATDESTFVALGKAKAPRAAEAMRALLATD